MRKAFRAEECVRIVERGRMENGGGEEDRNETNNIIVRGQRKYLSFKVHRVTFRVCLNHRAKIQRKAGSIG